MKQAGANPVKVTAIWEFEIVLSFVVIFMGKVDAILEFPKNPQKSFRNRLNKELAHHQRNGYNENHEAKSRADLSV